MRSSVVPGGAACATSAWDLAPSPQYPPPSTQPCCAASHMPPFRLLPSLPPSSLRTCDARRSEYSAMASAYTKRCTDRRAAAAAATVPDSPAAPNAQEVRCAASATDWDRPRTLSAASKPASCQAPRSMSRLGPLRVASRAEASAPRLGVDAHAGAGRVSHEPFAHSSSSAAEASGQPWAAAQGRPRPAAPSRAFVCGDAGAGAGAGGTGIGASEAASAATAECHCDARPMLWPPGPGSVSRSRERRSSRMR
mmetsp:Transcript_2292/g.6669  ORF Transcript_2292/g.6669 Transcript_2292/m.6669 type:complete len:252 (+) Transcript_2292:1878-2633(+)